MLYHVVISHNQTEHIQKFPQGSVFVFDAPTHEDIKECERLGYPYVVVPQTGNRGANRNAGLSYVLNTYKPNYDDVIEFFDGDRFPVQYHPDEILSLMDKHGIKVVLYTCTSDARLQRVCVNPTGATIIDTGTLCNPFYSCGFAIRVSAVYEIEAFNGGFLFEPRFTLWGCEDQILGLVCDYLHLDVAITGETLLNGSVGGDSDEHENYRMSLQQYVNMILSRKLPIRTEQRPFKFV